MPKTVAIIQARLGSERFPKKVLAQIPPESGISMLELVVRKALLATSLDDVVVVTPDRFIAVLCNRWAIKAFMPTWRERDVVREFMEAANELDADPIVRLTADCPLLRPEVIDEVVGQYLQSDADIAFNTDESTGQLAGEGSDVECFSYEALKLAYVQAQGEEREHSSLWIRRHMKTLFVSGAPMGIKSVNTQDDYRDVVRIVRNK